MYWPRYFGYDAKKEYFYEYGEILTDDELDWKQPVALFPPQRESRLPAQRGYFTIHGYDGRPIEKIGPSLVRGVDLSPDAVREAREELEYSGTDEYAIYPDLEGLARRLRRRYKLDPR